jgi:hypothetical protein
MAVFEPDDVVILDDAVQIVVVLVVFVSGRFCK